MEFDGVVPSDAPDPGIASEARLRNVGFPVFHLAPQPALTRLPIANFAESSGEAGREELSVALSYTLWMHPDDHSDPRNEIALDDRTRRMLDEEPAWGRPAWLAAQAQSIRYPMLWEAVRTAWYASPGRPHASVEQQLVDHVDHILRNSFREELGLDRGSTVLDGWRATTTAVREGTVRVDGRERPAVQIDTDPLVYAVGFRVAPHVVCTSVVSRDRLPSIDFALVTEG
jgi:hypothetical protein